MAEWEDWRKALQDGKAAGSIWQGSGAAHLQNQVQRIDDEKVAVAAGNKYGSAWIKAFPDKVEVILFDGGGKVIRREEFATPS